MKLIDKIDIRSYLNKDDIVQKTNNYFQYHNMDEICRLDAQSRLVNSFQKYYYNSILENSENLTVLDVGCNLGINTVQLFDHPNVRYLMGVDLNDKVISTANSKFGSSTREFLCADVCNEAGLETITNRMKEIGLDGFSIINISFVLLHIAKPERLLRELKDLLVPGGFILIRDIDDGANIIYPDVDGWWNTAMERIATINNSGYRYNARQIPTQLANAGYTGINLFAKGLDTTSMTKEQRMDFFKMYWQFVMEDLDLTKDRNDAFLRNQINTVLKQQFESGEIFFYLGVMSFIGIKPVE